MVATRFIVRNYQRNGLSLSFELVAVDANGTIDTAFTGTALFMATSPVNASIPGLPTSYTFTAADQGARAFNTTIATIENVQIFATDVGGSLSGAAIYIGGTGPDSFTGGAGGDVFDPNGSTNNLTGNGGEDTFYLTGGTNTVDAGANADRLVINWAGGAISNTVALSGSLATGYSGTIAGGGFSAAFQRIEHFTINTTGNASDNITTGDGEDEYSQLAFDSSTYLRDVVNLGGGIDRLSVDARNTNGALSFLALNYNGSGEIALYGNGKLGFTNVERFFLQGGNAADDLRGLDFADRFDGNAGADRIAGRGGDDDLRGGAGADVIDGDGRVTILLTADNQNNQGTGSADNDFRVSGVYNLANPFEADLAVGLGNVGTVRMRIRANDVEDATAGFAPEVDEVYVNDVLVGTLAQFADNATGDTIITFDSSLIAGGTARVRIQNVNATQDYGFRIDDVEFTLEKTGNDRLNGGAGVDQLVGGRGDDAYLVDEERDQVQEQAGQGTETVLSSARSFTLGANVENLSAALPAVAVSPTVESLINPTVVNGTQHPTSVTVLSDGGYVITWYDVPRTDVRARVFNADGSARTAEFLVHSSSTGNQGQFGISAVALSNGGFLVAYIDTPGASSAERIAGRVFDASGVAQGLEYTLTDAAGTFDSFPVMARLNNGQIALVSQNGASDGNGTFAISYRLLNADGSVGAGAPVILNTTTAGDQVGPVVAKLDDGRLIAVWESGDPGGKVFRGRFIDAGGTPVGNDFVISAAGGESPASGETRAAITAVNGGGFAVAWGITNEIVGRVFDSNGAPLAPPFTVNQRTDGAQTTVALTRLAEGGFMAAWTSDNAADGDAHSIVARLFNADGTPRGDDFVVNQIGTRFQLFPELAMLGDGRVVAAFSSDVPGSGADYEGKQILLDTTPDQVLVGNELVNVITGGFANDILAGSGGGDTLTGNQGADIIYGGDFTGSGTNLVTNGGFETQDGANNTRAFILAQPDGVAAEIAFRGVTSLFGWTRGNTSASIELETRGAAGQFYATAEGDANVNLEYATNQQQSLAQDIGGLTAGQKYLLKFAANQVGLSGNFTATMQVVWNGVVIDTVTSQTKTPAFYSYILEAATTGSGAGGANRLEFRETSSGDGGGTTLDAISLEALIAAPDMAVGMLGPNLITNGSFEQRDASTTSRDYTLAGSTDFNGGEPIYRFSDQLLGWGFLAGSTRVEFNTENPNNPRNEFQTGDGLVGLDMEVTGGEQVGIFQDVAGLTAGQRYRITVSVAQPIGPDSSAAVQVIWNGRVVGTVTPTSLTPTDYSFDVFAQANGAGAGGANRIAFQEVGGNGGSGRGALLDNVRLNLVAAADAGADTVDYSRESGTGAVVVNLSATDQFAGQITVASNRARDSFGAIDTLVSIENVITGAGNDRVFGSDGVNIIATGAGDDFIDGGAGDDSLAGGIGDDIYLVDSNGDIVTELPGEGADVIRTALPSYTLASANVENLTGTNAAGQTLTGDGNANVIEGAGGNDVIDGGGGVDTLVGGQGNDVYVVDTAGDVVTELPGQGTDTIRTALASYTLASANVENLTGANAAGQTLTGDANANVVTGAAGNDSIDGGGGIDTLVGGEGNDTYTVDGTDDVVTEAAGQGVDTIRTALASYTLASAHVENLTGTNAAGQTLTGDANANTITGAGGDDLIDGGGGVDTLVGGAGSDTYTVDGADDVVTESTDGGADTIRTALASYTLVSANVENLTGTSAAGQALTGAANANTITGAGGNDTLNGNGGTDNLVGGGGDDIYIVDSLDDIVTELASGGFDEVRSSVSGYVLPGEVERLVFTGAAGGTLIGNGAANDFQGGAGSDLINLSQGGEDSASGGLGDDGFYVGGALSPGDALNGGGGLLDQIGLQGNYGTFGLGAAPYIFSAANFSVLADGAGTEFLVLLAGNDVRFSDASAGALLSYNLKTVDANVASGQRLVVSFNTLRVGENVTFDGSAEGDGQFLTFGGRGNDVLTGGAGNDGLYFGSGRFGSGDRVDGGAGAMDTLGLQGDYSRANAVVFGANQISNIDMLVLLSGGDLRFNTDPNATYNYDITMNDANVLGNAQLAVSANTLISTETLKFNGAAETGGRFLIFSGDGADTLIGGGGADEINGRGGNDRITGGLGADQLRGGDGADVFAYLSTDDSKTGFVDQILDFGSGDTIDLSAVDANVSNGSGDDSFRSIGGNNFTGGGAAGAGELRFAKTGGVWTVEGDTNGDGMADFILLVTTADPMFELTGGSFVP